MPDWYSIDQGAKRGDMYSDTAINQCDSVQLTITSSSFTVRSLSIAFMQVADGYYSGKEIEITCKGFKNPIYPDLWGPFGLKVYDLTIVQGKQYKYQITYNNLLTFDATQYTPVILPQRNFKITVGDPVVQAWSQWIFNLDVPTPLESDCFIKVLLPSDLEYNSTDIVVRGTKIF